MTHKQDGHWGNTTYGWDFIPSGQKQLVAGRPLLPEELEPIQPLFHPTTTDMIRMHLGKLALLKKIGGITEATMPIVINSMAVELAEFSQLAVLLAFKQIKREEGAWMPDLGKIITIVEQWQHFVADLYLKSIASQNLLLQNDVGAPA